jgi:thioredoxin reductase
LQMDENGFIQGGEKGKTSQKGIFVAWEVSDSIYQQAITSSAQGAQAAFWVVDYLQEIWQF